MGKAIWILFLAFCVLAVHTKEKSDKEKEESTEPEGEDSESNDDVEDKAESGEAEDTKEAGSDEETPDEEEKPFVCNLKYKRIGCYADKGSKDKPLASFLESDDNMGKMEKRGKVADNSKFNGELPKFACKCANDALNNGNAIFGLQNIAECWSGPDDSKYDKDGESEDCVTFDYAKCEESSDVCTGKKHANFMYYVDTPDHTKSQEEIKAELEEEKKKADEEKKKQEKAAKKLKKKGKKGKKQH